MNNLADKMTNQLELDVRELARQLYDEARAFIFKVPEELQQTPVDFFGFTPSGRAIAIECKQVKRARLPIGTSNGLQPHQWNALELAHKCGAVSLLIWRNGERTAVLPFRLIPALIGDKKSIPWIPSEPSWEWDVRRELQLPIVSSTA